VLNGLVPNDGVKLARSSGKATLDDKVPAKLNHFSAHVAMDEQSSIALSHGFVCGQQSMSSIADISAKSADLAIAPMPPAAGSVATENAITSARMVRAMFMALLCQPK
jgi:hypothetical protein